MSKILNTLLAESSLLKAGLCITFFIFSLKSDCLLAQIDANFSSNNLEACGSLQTTFYDQSTSSNSILSWAWDLGGNTSSQQNPGAIFTEPGQYTICLTVTDVEGNSDTECKENYITIYPNPVANFESDVTEGCAPVLVSYTDLSTSENGQIAFWLWGLGGSTGVINTNNPDEVISSSYTNGGNYTVSLTVEDSLGCSDTYSQPNFVTVYQIPQPDIQFELLSSCQLPWEIQFVNSNADASVNYIWDFGNEQTFEGESPPIINYTEVGEYDITLYMTSGDCADTVQLQGFIDTDASASFSFQPQSSCVNSSIQFTDESILEAESVLWTFGDGNSSTESNPNHTYINEGCYDVSLIRYAAECSDTVTISCIQVSPAPNVEVLIENQFNCTLPTTVTLQGNTSSIGDYHWEFVDGQTTQEADSNNVPILIQEFGMYYVHMTFSDTLGCVYTEDSIPIHIQPFEAHLPSMGPSGCAPLNFTLSDSVIGQAEIASWEWNIGNPIVQNSSVETPSFTLQDTGRYDVQLIVENVNGCVDTIEVEDYIKVGMVPEVDFMGTPLEACRSVVRDFEDLSSPFADEWTWYFGTSDTISIQNPSYTFDLPGMFDVQLTSSHNGCSNTLLLEDYITVFEPASRFIFEYNCEDPYTVNIENRSLGADSLFWTLYLSETDSLILTDSVFGLYTFPDRGKYAVSLYSKNFESGCEDIRIDTAYIVDPIASYTLDTLRGCAPLEIQLGDFSQDAFIYEYLSDDGTIDSIFNSEPSITFTEGGILNGPLLIVTDIHECKDSFQLMDSVIVNQLKIAVDFNNVICVPNDLNLFDESSDELGNIISWQWNVGESLFTSSSMDTTVFIDSVGIYDLFLKVVDDWGCVDSILLRSAINAVEIVPDFISDTLGCTWSPISFTALGDNGFVAGYEWDFGDGNTSNAKDPDHFYQNEGTYSVCLTMSDSRGCSKTICKENIVSIINPQANFSGDPIFATCPPLLTNFQNGSTNSVSYIWDFGDNSGLSENEAPSHVYTSPGAFDVQLIAQSTSKCFDTLLLEDFVRVEGPSGEFEFEISPSCIPISVELIAESDGFYSYTWDYGNGVLDSVAGLVIVDTTSYIYNETGIFTPKLIITDSIGCSRSFAGDAIIVNDLDLEFIKTTEPLCGPPLEVLLENMSSGSTTNVTYNWLIEGPESISSNEDSPVININESGIYDVNLIASYDNCLDTLSKTDFLEIADIPVVSFDLLTDAFCENVNAEFLNTTTLGYGTVTTWLWDFGDGSTSSNENPTHQYTGQESRTVSLMAITDKGCESTFSTTFDVLPSMIGEAGEDQLICIGDETQLSGEIINLLEGGSFYWLEDASLSCLDCLGPIVNPMSTTSYVLVSVHPNGCESRDTLEVTVIPIPGPEIELNTDSIICLGAESIISVVDFNEDYQYVWDSSVSGQDCYEDCESVTVSPEFETTYFVTVFNEFGCFDSDSVMIDVETSYIDFLPTVRAICEGQSTTIGTSGGNNPVWLTDADISCTTCEEITISPLKSKKYFVEVESDIGCVYLDSIQVIVVPEKSVFAGNDQEICLGETIELFASGFGQAKWTPSTFVEDSIALITKATPSNSGFISLVMTYDECSQSDSLFVEVHTKAEISTIGDSICAGETGLLTAEGRADQFRWLINSSDDAYGSDVLVSGDETKMIEVIGQYRSCQPDTAEALLYVYPKIDYVLEERNYTLHLNDEILIQPNYDSTRNYIYEWFPEEGLDCIDCPSPVIDGIMQNMEYSLWVTDEVSNCNEELSIHVRFLNDCTQNVFHLPNIFIPTSIDNNRFKLSTKNPEEFVSMSIYDRWGNQVFISDDIQVGWDGQYNSQFVASGVYVYKISLICPITNKDYVILGDITVLR